MAEKKNKVFGTPRVRNIFIVVVALAAVVMLVVASLKPEPIPEPESSLATPAKIDTTPGYNDNPVYQQRVHEENLEQAEQAERVGGSSVPTITGLDSNEPADPFASARQEAEEDSMAAYAEELDQKAADARQQRQQQATARRAPQQELNKAMENQMLVLMERWGEKLPSKAVTLNAQLAQAPAAQTPASENNQESGTALPKAPALYRAGDIIPAVVDTEISTDYSGAARATIVSGPLRGAYAVGTFTRQRDTVLLRFNTLSLPQKGSQSVDLVAVDPKTGNSGIQSDVDHHYLERYAALMGGILVRSMGAYGDILAEENTTTTLDNNGNAVNSTGEKDSNARVQAAVAQGVGGVADDAGDEIRKGFQREETVYVYQSEPVGLFVMNDIPETILK